MNNIKEKRVLGNTNIEVSPLCFGCASAYARDLISDDKAVELFKTAYDLGINFFDTGHSYGRAEERIGLSLKQIPYIKREDVIISTKFGTRVGGENGHFHDVSTDWIKKSVELSLNRMGIDYIDVLYLHNTQDEDLHNEEMFNCLDDLKRQGIIRATGSNTFHSNQIQEISDNRLFDVVMLDYNIVKKDREPLIESLYNNGIGVVAGQALAEGVFLNEIYKVREIKDLWYLARTFGRKSSRKLFFDSRRYKFLNKLKDNLDGSQVALKYVVDNKYVASASFGTCSFDHLKKNVEALDLDVPKDIYDKIKKL